MADTFFVEVVTPYRLLISEEAEELTAPGEEGEFGVLAGHTPFLTILKPGELTYKKGSKVVTLAISRGYAEVLPDKTTVLVDSAKEAGEIDLQAARSALAKAEEALKGLSTEDPGYQAALDAVATAEAETRVREKAKAP